MPSSYSNSSPSNSPIILDSEASTIVMSDSDDDSVTSSIFGFTCQICELRAKNATELEYKYLEDDLPLLDSDGVHWGKCDACGSCGHLVCWEEYLGHKIQWDNRFYCCKYVVEWCPIVYFYLLNSVYRVLQATNIPSNKRRKPPRPQSGSKRGKRTSRSNHKGDKLQLWDILDMRNALVQYFSQRAPGYTRKKFGYKKIADAYSIPRETFRRRVRGPLTGLFGHLSGGKSYPCIFTPEEEEELAEHISKFAQSGFPFTTVEIRGLGFEYAQERGIEGFSGMKKVAGRKWFKGFMSRHAGLTLKSPKLLSVYRAKCANRDVLNGWFDVYEEGGTQQEEEEDQPRDQPEPVEVISIDLNEENAPVACKWGSFLPSNHTYIY